MGLRADLQKLLEDILGSKNVYFQPPESVKMRYPCIVYHLTSENKQFADNIPYRKTKRYQVTVIDKDPDSEIPNKIGALPMSIFDRFYTANNLNHFIYNIYF